MRSYHKPGSLPDRLRKIGEISDERIDAMMPDWIDFKTEDEARIAHTKLRLDGHNVVMYRNYEGWRVAFVSSTFEGSNGTV